MGPCSWADAARNSGCVKSGPPCARGTGTLGLGIVGRSSTVFGRVAIIRPLGNEQRVKRPQRELPSRRVWAEEPFAAPVYATWRRAFHPLHAELRGEPAGVTINWSECLPGPPHSGSLGKG